MNNALPKAAPIAVPTPGIGINDPAIAPNPVSPADNAYSPVFAYVISVNNLDVYYRAIYFGNYYLLYIANSFLFSYAVRSCIDSSNFLYSSDCSIYNSA